MEAVYPNPQAIQAIDDIIAEDVDRQILRLIDNGKNEEALRMVKKPFTCELLTHLALSKRYDLLWKFYQEAVFRQMDLEPFILQDVIGYEYVGTIEFLFRDKGVDPNSCFGEFNKTPLMEACSRDKYEIVQILLDVGADPEQIDSFGQNSFFYVVNSYKVEILDLLYRRTGKIDYVSFFGRTLLHRMCEPFIRRSKMMLDAILHLDLIDVNHQDKNGNTALHMAVDNFEDFFDYRYKYQLLILLNHPKADLTIKNHCGKTAWDLCRENKQIPANIKQVFQVVIMNKGL